MPLGFVNAVGITRDYVIYTNLPRLLYLVHVIRLHERIVPLMSVITTRKADVFNHRLSPAALLQCNLPKKSKTENPKSCVSYEIK